MPPLPKIITGIADTSLDLTTVWILIYAAKALDPNDYATMKQLLKCQKVTSVLTHEEILL